MKKIIAVIFVFITVSCYTSQKVSFADTDFFKVYEIAGSSQNELFLKANEWMVSIFKDAKSVIQHTDKEEGVIIGKYLMKSLFGAPNGYGGLKSNDIYAIIDIRTKENKVRISIKPYDYTYVDYSPYSKNTVLTDMESLAESFNQALQTKKIEF